MGSAISVLYLPKHQPTFHPTSRLTHHSTMVWEAVFKFFDGDNSGMIDFNEVKTKSAALGASADKLAKLEAIFKAHDADGNGELDAKEFEGLMEKRIEKAFSDIDSDKSGNISPAELKAADKDGDGEISISEFRDALASKPKEFLPILFS